METEPNTPLAVPEPRAGRRRRFSNAEKRSILEEAQAPGQTVSSVGRRYGLSVSLLFRWKRQLEAAAGKDGGRLAARALLNHRLRELETQVDSLKAENALLRDTLERSRREGRAPALPGRLGAEELRPDGRA